MAIWDMLGRLREYRVKVQVAIDSAKHQIVLTKPEVWSWYRIVSESGCVYWYQATSMQEAHAQYDEEYLDPYDAGSHIHCSTVVTEEQVLKEKGNLEEGGE